MGIGAPGGGGVNQPKQGCSLKVTRAPSLMIDKIKSGPWRLLPEPAAEIARVPGGAALGTTDSGEVVVPSPLSVALWTTAVVFESDSSGAFFLRYAR